MELDRIARAFSMRQQEMNWRVRQLNELYGPLRMLRSTSKSLRDSLPRYEPNGERWRLVRHLPDAKARDEYRIIVDEILRIGGAIEDLLINKAGLMESVDLPPSFAQFMHHSRLLRIAWELGADFKSEPGVTDISDIPFPDEIDQDISKAIAVISAALEAAQAVRDGDA